jgi:hypothetical protein
MPKAGDYLSEENEHSAHYAQMMRYPVDIYLFFYARRRDRFRVTIPLRL